MKVLAVLVLRQTLQNIYSLTPLPVPICDVTLDRAIRHLYAEEFACHENNFFQLKLFARKLGNQQMSRGESD